MTTTPRYTVITTRTRRGANTALSISYDSIDSATLMLACPPRLRSLIDQAIDQWWTLLSPSQRSVLGERGTSFKISVDLQNPLPSLLRRQTE